VADLKAGRITEQALPDIAPGAMEPATVTFKFSPARTSRVRVTVVSKEEDFNRIDHLWGLSFTRGESTAAGPRVGTDIPDVFHAPALMNLVSLPDLPALRDLVSLPTLGNMFGGDFALPNVAEIGDTLKGRVDTLKGLIRRDR
jgi:hypothetical protein